MCRPVLTGTLLCQFDFVWRGIIGVDREIAVIHAVAFSAADHSCAETDEKNRLHRVSGRLYKVGFIWVGPMTASSSRHWLDAILPYFKSSFYFGAVGDLPQGEPLARPDDGIPQSHLAIGEDVHRGPCARHRDVKLCFVHLAECPNWHADNDLVDCLCLARVTGHSYSLVDMQSGAVANDFAFVEYDFGLINAHHGPQLVVRESLPAVFDVFREADLVADRERHLLPLEHAELLRLVEWQLLLGADKMSAYGGGMSRSLQILRTNKS
jgi:hypothetical protein